MLNETTINLASLLSKYKPMVSVDGRSVLVETGTHRGDGIAAALDAGFNEIHSFEIDAVKVSDARKRFAGKPVTVYHASSASKRFSELVSSMEHPALFWLDAHLMGPSCNPKPDTYPLKIEIAVVAKSRFANVVLCDDMRLFSRYGTSVSEIMRELAKSGTRYKFIVESCRKSIPLDVLACYQEV